MDIDRVEIPNAVKELVENDKFVFSAFISISGSGLCLIFRIDGSYGTLTPFEGIGAYLYGNLSAYHRSVMCKNISRSRFVSYDPYMVTNTSALIFKKYPAKKKVQPRNEVVFVQSDFDEIIVQMFNRGVNICEDYAAWIACAYSLISEFEEAGRVYYHTLSSLSSKYNQEDTDKQFDACLKNHNEGKSKKAGIGSIYHFAKQAGIDIYSPRTKEIIRATLSQSKAGSTPDGISGYPAKISINTPKRKQAYNIPGT